MSTSRLQLGTWLIVALVLMRLTIGWHFYHEGTQKFVYDQAEGRYRIVFSAESFLRQATGPLAGLFHAQVPSTHNWWRLLAVAREHKSPTAEEADEQARWLADYEARRDAAVRKKEPVPIEFPPFAAYHDWATRIADDWRADLGEVTAIAGLTDEQRRQAADVFVRRHQQLADYLAEQSSDITDYQHELWRLEQMREAPEATAVPYQQERIAAKTAETRSTPRGWLRQVQEFDLGYQRDLRNVLTEQQRSDQSIAAAMDDALADPRQAWHSFVNVAVTVLTLGVGVCLMVGLLTPLAALVGAGFLLAVIASQPPWTAGSIDTYYQCVEFTGLLVLAATGAGRWAGLDYFLSALCQKCCRRKPSPSSES